MIVVSDDLDAEVAGTSVGDTLVVTAWRGGAVVAANLAVKSFSLTWDATTDQVHQGRGTVVIADPDGLLAPWGMGEPLGPGGSRLMLAWVSGVSGIRVPRGTWRIRGSKPAEKWRVYNTPPVQTTVPDGYVDTYTDLYGATVSAWTASERIVIPGGGDVTLTIEEDPTASASICRIDGDAPIPGATALSEIRRIMADYGAVDSSLSPADVTIQPSYVAFHESRTDSVGDLLDMLMARSRVGGDGSLQVIPFGGVGPVWTIQGGEDGVLVEVDRELKDAGVYNAATSKGTAADGSPINGHAYITAGPLIYGGPYGKVPVFHQAIATTQSGVTADAASYLAQVTTSGTIDLPVLCLAHPALQVHDLVTVIAPTRAGDAALVGRVVGMTWSSAGAVPAKQMTLTVRVTAEALEAVAMQVSNG